MDRPAGYILQMPLLQRVLDQFFLVDKGGDDADGLILMQGGIPDDLLRLPVGRVFDLSGGAFYIHVDKGMLFGACGTDAQF